jgi:hypothetical protein
VEDEQVLRVVRQTDREEKCEREEVEERGELVEEGR